MRLRDIPTITDVHQLMAWIKMPTKYLILPKMVTSDVVRVSRQAYFNYVRLVNAASLAGQGFNIFDISAEVPSTRGDNYMIITSPQADHEAIISELFPEISHRYTAPDLRYCYGNSLQLPVPTEIGGLSNRTPISDVPPTFTYKGTNMPDFSLSNESSSQVFILITCLLIFIASMGVGALMMLIVFTHVSGGS